MPKRLSKRLARLEAVAQAEPQTAEAREVLARLKELVKACERLAVRMAGGGGDG